MLGIPSRSHFGSSRFMDSRNSRSAFIRSALIRSISCSRALSSAGSGTGSIVMPANWSAKTCFKSFRFGVSRSLIGRSWLAIHQVVEHVVDGTGKNVLNVRGLI